MSVYAFSSLGACKKLWGRGTQSIPVATFFTFRVGLLRMQHFHNNHFVGDILARRGLHGTHWFGMANAVLFAYDFAAKWLVLWSV